MRGGAVRIRIRKDDFEVVCVDWSHPEVANIYVVCTDVWQRVRREIRQVAEKFEKEQENGNIGGVDR